jgi:hypothetical protein
MFVNDLAAHWLPAVPHLHARLQADPPARIADIARGAGWALIALADSGCLIVGDEKVAETFTSAGSRDRETSIWPLFKAHFGLPEDTLDELPLPSQLGRTHIGGIDLNKPRIRSTVTAVLALTAAPGGFTVKDLALKVHAMTGQTDWPHPRRRPKPPDGPQTRHLDPRRPPLRKPAHQYAYPFPRRRHHHGSVRGIDNILSIEVPQAPRHPSR